MSPSYRNTPRIRLPAAAEQLEERLSESSLERRRKRANNRATEFLAGPINVAWLKRAIAIRGKHAVSVGLAIWFLRGMLKRTTDLSLNPATLNRFGIDRFASYRGIRALENAGLILVRRHRGQSPLISINSVPEKSLTGSTEFELRKDVNDPDRQATA
jgi:hypothetical protein